MQIKMHQQNFTQRVLFANSICRYTELPTNRKHYYKNEERQEYKMNYS